MARRKTPPKGTPTAARQATMPIIVIPPPPPPAPPVQRTGGKEKPMAGPRRPPQRRAKLPARVGKHVGLTYSAAVGDAGLEAGCAFSEASFALLSVAADYAADLTDTEVDNTALAYGKPLLGNAIRVYAGRSLAKKHPGLAEVLRAGASAWNGDSLGQSFRRAGVRVQEKTLRKVAGENQGGR